eukprot:NODE_5449_length_576_cov_75.741935_g4730_i0.p1 GENE.NODE_5449_length_576_cov_75.741935_g4730_i0~~NODE_5449_length_576_cov_75.741935_g4730_i0.p1  ORF type:complete len:180 (+),score=39.15 NODE_5449_length_576_cov_75.741935_g4730_i0:25-540(+)
MGNCIRIARLLSEFVAKEIRGPSRVLVDQEVMQEVQYLYSLRIANRLMSMRMNHVIKSAPVFDVLPLDSARPNEWMYELFTDQQDKYKNLRQAWTAIEAGRYNDAAEQLRLHAIHSAKEGPDLLVAWMGRLVRRLQKRKQGSIRYRRSSSRAVETSQFEPHHYILQYSTLP